MSGVSAAPLGACPAGQACVAVHLPPSAGGGVDYVSSDMILAGPDVPQSQYLVYLSADHQEYRPVTGLSMAGVISATLGDAGGVRAEVVDPTNGSVVNLSNDDIVHPEGQFSDHQPAVFRSQIHYIDFFRPQRTATEVNAYDCFTSQNDDTDIDVYLHTGPLLAITITPDIAKPRVGDTVTFTATATNAAAAQNPLHYSWSINGQTRTTPTTTYKFTDQASHEIKVSMTGSGDADGVAVLYLAAGPPKDDGGPGPSDPGHHHHHDNGGHGPGDGGPGQHGNGPGSDGDGHGDGNHPGDSHPQQDPSPDNTSTGSAQHHDSSDNDNADVSGGESSEPPPPQQQHTTVDAPSLPAVDGRVVGAGSAVSMASLEGASAPRTASPIPSAEHYGIGVPVGSAAVILLLLGLGVGRETRLLSRVPSRRTTAERTVRRP